MDSLELVKKLYEGEIDLEVLAQDEREELEHLIEAKDALSALPRNRPPAGVVDAVVAHARGTKAGGGSLTLVRTGRMLQRLAAAAIVVVAVGVGYLTLRTDGLLPIEQQEMGARSTETEKMDSPRASELKDEVANAPILAESNQKPQAEPSRQAPTVALGRESGQVGNTFAMEGLERRSRDNDMVLPEEEMAPADMLLAGDDAVRLDSSFDEDSELLRWDEEEEALTTFFWQVQALQERSPDEEWEEAVPLEGSFRHLEKQRPHDGRWLETGRQR